MYNSKISPKFPKFPKSLDTFSKCFAFMPTFPLGWDIQSQKLVSFQDPKLLLPWMALTLTLFLSNSVVVVLLLSEILGLVDLTISEVVLSILLLSLGGLSALLDFITAAFTRNAAQAFNCLAVLQKEIRT